MNEAHREPEVSSPSNPRIRAAAALRQRQERSKRGLTLVDGTREIRRALDAGVDVVEAFVCEPLLAGPDARAALDGLARRRIPMVRASPTAFAKVAFGERAEGLVAVIRAPDTSLAALDPPRDALIVVLEGVEKPGNLGAVLRSADGAGADAVVVADPRTDLANPNVIRASAGTCFALPMASGSSEEVLAWLRRHGVRILAARVEAARLYTDADLTGPLALVLGAEDVGLTDAWAGVDVVAVRIPMRGVADSLNVSVSAALLLYEARRQRDRHVGPSD